MKSVIDTFFFFSHSFHCRFLFFIFQKLCCSVYLGVKNPICHFNFDFSIWRELCASLITEVQQSCGWKMSCSIKWWQPVNNHSWIALCNSLRTVATRSTCKLCCANCSPCVWGSRINYFSITYETSNPSINTSLRLCGSKSIDIFYHNINWCLSLWCMVTKRTTLLLWYRIPGSGRFTADRW